jgi:hypothetical protein
LTEPPDNQGAGASNQVRSLTELGSKNALAKEARGRGVVFTRKDNGIHHVAVGDQYYKRTPAGYLVKVTHRYGGPENNDSDTESDSECSPLEVPRSLVASTMANAAKGIPVECLVIPIGTSLPPPPFPCFLKA